MLEWQLLLNSIARGKRLCKVRKNPKIPRKNWIELTQPTHPLSNLIFWKYITAMDKTLKS